MAVGNRQTVIVDMHSTGQKSHCSETFRGHRTALFSSNSRTPLVRWSKVGPKVAMRRGPQRISMPVHLYRVSDSGRVWRGIQNEETDPKRNRPTCPGTLPSARAKKRSRAEHHCRDSESIEGKVLKARQIPLNLLSSPVCLDPHDMSRKVS